MAKQNNNHVKPELKEDGIEYVIASPFRDKSNFNIEYKAGEPAVFEGERLAELIEKGLVIKA